MIDRDKRTSSADKFMGAHTILHEGDPYMTRYWFWRLRVHVFHRGDKDTDPHDHPWDFWTFPLTSYVEDVWYNDGGIQIVNDRVSPVLNRRREVVRAWRWNKRLAEHTHQVLGTFEGWQRDTVAEGRAVPEPRPLIGKRKIVTIVWRGAPGRRWGFWKKREGLWCWQDWKTYVLKGGRNQPCE